MDSKVSEKDMREVYFQAFGKEYDSADRKQAPLPLEIAYLTALNKLKREGKYAGGGEITDDAYYQSVNHFVYFCMNYPRNFLDAFGSLKNHLSNKFKNYYNKYGTYGVMIQFYAELDAENRRTLTDYSLKNYKGTPIDSDVSEIEYFNSVNHFIFFCFNFPPNFMDAFSSHLKVHLSSKWTNAYEKKGSVGAMIYFWSELDNENRRKLADWVRVNYTGTRLYEVGGALGDVAGMLPSPLPMSTIQAMADGGSIENNYKDKTEQDIWNNIWNYDQKFHFLSDHVNEIGFDEEFYNQRPKSTKRIQGSNGAEIGFRFIDKDKIIDTKYVDLPRYVKHSLQEHIRGGQYADGGSTGKQAISIGGQLELFSDGGGVDYYELQDLKNKESVLEKELHQISDNQSDGWRIDLALVRSELESVREEISKLENKYADGGGVKSDYYIFEGMDNLNGKPLYRVESTSESDNEYVGEWHTDKSDAEKELKSLENKFSDGGGVGKKSDRNETQENNFGVSYKLGDKFILGKNFGNNKDVEVSITEIMPSGLFFKVDKSDKTFSIKTLHSKGSTYTSGEYLIPIKKDYADGGEIKEGDRVLWRGNDYILSKIKENMVAGFRDTKYHLTSTKKGVEDANLDSLRDVKKVSFKNGGGVDDDSKFINFKKQLIKYSDFNEKTGDGFSSRYVGLKNKKGDKSNGEYLIEGNTITWVYIDEKGNEYISDEVPEFIIDLTGKKESFNKRYADGGGVEVNLEDDFKKALVTSNFTYYTDGSDGIRMFRNSDNEELTDSSFAENSLSEDIENNDIVWASEDMQYNIDAMREEFSKGGSTKVYKYGGEIEERVKEKLSRNFTLPFEVVVYVPSTQDADKTVSKEEFMGRITEVETYLAKLFGGFSANPVDGGYNSDEKGLITEDVFKVYSFASRDGFEPKMEKLVVQIKDWCKTWGQEAIGLEFEGDLFYVEA